MSKKLLLLIGLIALLTSSVWAATTITLTNENHSVLNTALSVMPDLDWTDTAAPAPHHYRLVISTTPSMSSPVFNAIHADNTALPIANFLNYNTTYYWRVYPENADNSSAGDASDIGSFTTPKMSVVPYLRWTAIEGAGNYYVSVDNGTTWIDTEGTNLYFKVPNANALAYNTTCNWKVRRGAAGTIESQTSFTTKPLNIITEKYEYSTNNQAAYSALSPYATIESHNTDNWIRYIALTDEFETITAANVNASFTALSSISDPNRAAIPLVYSAPGAVISTIQAEAYQTIISKAMSVIPADGITAVNPNIEITNDETLTLKFQYGANLIVNTPSPTRVNITTINAWVDNYAGALALGNETDDADLGGLYFRFNTAGLAAQNNSELVAVKNVNTGVINYVYAYKTAGQNYYQINLTRTYLNSITNVNHAHRLSVYPYAQPSVKKDFIWLAQTGTASNANTASFTEASITPAGTATLTATGFVRFTSTVDPVGFVVNSTTTTQVKPGLTTNPLATPPTIEAAIASPAIYAKTMAGANIGAGVSINIVNYTLENFTMTTPTNFSFDVDIYPRLSWTDALPTRGTTDLFYYQLVISKNPDLSAPILTVNTTQNYYYPSLDLEFDNTYYWRVIAKQGGVDASPVNIGVMGAWTFTTTSDDASYRITSTIPADRTLNVLNTPYTFDMSPGNAANTTLFIQEGTTLKFTADTKLSIAGNLAIVDAAADGITEETIFTNTTGDDTEIWQGIEFTGSSRNALVVGPNDEYISGNLLKEVTINYAKNPVAGATADTYFHTVTIQNNQNGIETGNSSYFVNATINTFLTSSITPKYGIKGGRFFNNVTISGTSFAEKFGGYGILTSNQNAVIKNSTITFVTGNAIECNSAVTTAGITVHNNTIRGNAGIAIKAIKGSKITKNTIGGDAANQGNTGTAIVNGSYIAENNIQKNGAIAITADAAVGETGATVVNNIIINNPGAGIVNGKIINGNRIENSNPVVANYTGKDAIKADPTATVTSNIILNNAGYGINGGKTITSNSFEIQDLNITGPTAAANYAITATASQNAVITDNVITKPYGFGILNGKTIQRNRITGHSNNISGAYGIKAETGAIVTDNIITDIKGLGIENGTTIHNNTLSNLINYVKGEATSTITNNTINSS